MITIMASIAQQESQSISQNVKMGIRYGMQEGIGMLNTSAFMGLKKGKKRGEWVISPEEAEVVRRIFREYLNGYSPAMICRGLERDDILTPTGGTVWYNSTITHMLENEKYCGDLLMQKYYVEDFLTHRLVKNDKGALPQYLVENHHEAIIPREVYFQTQGELMRRAALKNDPSKIRNGAKMALMGRLICGRCGRVLKRYWKEDSAICDWRCSNRASTLKRNHQAAQASCGCRFVQEREVKAAIMTAFDRLPEYRDELLRKQGQIWDGELKRIDEMMLKAKAEEMRLVERQQTLMEDEEGNRKELDFLEEQIERIRHGRNGLALERAERANEEMQIRLLLELVDEMKTRAEETEVIQRRILQGQITAPDAEDFLIGWMGEEKPVRYSPACTDYEEFFRRTRKPIGDALLNDHGKFRRFSDDAVIRFLRNVTILDDGYEVCFKAGITIRV